ncbi:MAG TPA: hypothetical protein PLD03_09050, partial [Thiomonas arsenitoxydans]|nr:hypothetical protein [Thiomonas arsenitoxydans]
MAADVGAAQRQAESCSLFDTDAALREATRYHSGGKSGSFPYITWNWRQNGEERMQQKAVPVSRLALLIGQIPTRPRWREEHHYIVQHEFRRPDRRAIHLWAMGLLWADVDLRHEEGSSACSAAEIDGYVGRLLLDCSDNNIPEPSLVVWT